MLTLPAGPEQGRLAQTIAFHRDPLGVLRDAQTRFGDIFTLRMATTGPMVAIAAPELVPQIVKLPRAGVARKHVLPQASPRSAFGGDGEAHAAARGRAAPEFTPEAIAARRAGIERIAHAHVERWPRGRPFRLLPRMRALADEVFVREVLGATRAPEELTDAIGSLLYTPGNPPVSIPGRHDGLLGKLVDLEFRRRSGRVARLLEAEGKGDPDELLALLMAAQEPMATALTRVTLCAAGGGLPYSRAVAAEALRLFPPAVAALRELTEPLRARGYELAPGTVVMVPLALYHRDRRIFDDPDAFRADRDNGSAMPFGGGGRRCLGEHLAWAELDAIVPVALAAGVRPLGPQPEKMVLRGTILVPRRSGLVRA